MSRNHIYIFFLFFLMGNTVSADTLNKWVENVFEDLVEANGSWELERPELVILDRSHLASSRGMTPSPTAIVLDYNLIKISESFGARKKDAIALILGGKIIYYYHQKPAPDWGPALVDNVEMAKKNFFLVNKAGYYTGDILEDILRKWSLLYQNSKDQSIDNQLLIRKAINLEKEMRYLTGLTELGDYLTLINDYEAAIDCYRKILSEIDLKEIHNNLGILYVRQAISLSVDRKYVYPFEMDMVSTLRFRHPGLMENPDDKDRFVSIFVDQAENHFLKAKNLDMGYVSGWINLACLYQFNQEYEKANQTLEKAYDFLGKDSRSQPWYHARLIEGIIKAEEGNPEIASSIFRSVEKSRIPQIIELAKHNRNLLEEKEIEEPEMDRVFGFWEEKISGITLYEYSRQPSPDTTIYIEGEKYQREWGIKQLEDSRIYSLNSVENGKRIKTVSFHLNDLDYQGLTEKKIHIGDPESKIYTNYKAYPEWIRYAADGTYLIYSELGIIFKLNEERLVKSWCVYHLE